VTWRAFICCALAVMATACSEETSAPSAELLAPNALAVAGRNLLVANSARSELKVLYLGSDGRRYVRAPNPIYPLAVPTARLPRSIAAWLSPDGETTAPYAVALSPSESKASVLSTTDLSRLGDIALPDIALATTMLADEGGQNPRAVFASSIGEQGGLYLVTLPPNLTEDRAAVAALEPTLVVDLGRSIPQVMVASAAHPSRVIVGDRLTTDDGFGRAGGLVVADVVTGTVERYDVGGPVLALALDPTGQRVFGTLDASACDDCAGVFRFDLESRTRIPSGEALEIPGTATGIAVGAEATLNVASGDSATTPFATRVLVGAPNGAGYLGDGEAMRLIDTDADAPSATTSHREPDGAETEDANGPVDVVLSEGAARTENVLVVYEGVISGLGSRRASIASGSLVLGGTALDERVRPGDRVVFETAPSGCPQEAGVTSVAAGSLGLEAVDAACEGEVVVSVRVGQAYAVTGQVSGSLGRVAANETFTWTGTYWHRPEGFNPASPALTFTMGSGDPRRDAGYVVAVDSGVVPFVIPFDTLSMPGALAYDPKLKLFFVTFQGGNALIEMEPPLLVSGTTDSGVRAHR